MTYIFMGKPFTKFVPPKTYIFVPECPNLSTYGHVYQSQKPSHAEDNMASKCGLPSEFYLTSAPCPDCALMLMDKYKDKKEKPIIHIARPYIGPGKTKKGNKNVNMLCQAMLVHAGFKLKPWDWNSFKGYIDNIECEDAIDAMQKDDYIMDYKKRYEGTQKALNDVQDMATNQFNIDYKTECEEIVNG